MNEEQKAYMIAEAEKVEAVADFFDSLWSSAELYETTAKVCHIIMHKLAYPAAKLQPDELEHIQSFIDQHLEMIKAMEPFERKEDSHEG